jgi:2-polyprenyl-3-methyl-5-hydroxy-6-metoxy-1,4-benzoquinol methylase
MKFSIKKNKNHYLEVYPKPTHKFLKDFYEKTYFNNKTNATYSKSYSKEEIQNRKKRSMLYIKVAKSIIKKKDIRFLEIGCGEGFLLKAAHDEKFNVTGVDFQSNQLKKFNRSVLKFFKKTDPDNFLSIKSNIKYDIIAANFVLEHVRDPVNFFSSL